MSAVALRGFPVVVSCDKADSVPDNGAQRAVAGLIINA